MTESRLGLPTLESLCDPEVWPPPAPRPSDPPLRRAWLADGHVILPGLIPDRLTDAYVAARVAADGWELGVTPYMRVPALRALCCCREVADALAEILREPAGVHLNLCGWVSTERDWHADRYLNPPFVRDVYAAVWFALGDVHPDSGPFEWVIGSHRWPALDQGRVISALLDRGLTTRERVRSGAWPWDSEKLLTPVCEREASARGAKTEKFLGKKGDVLIWSSRLWHRGSPPAVPGTERRALIAHYSGISVRTDMPAAVGDAGGGHYFPLGDRRHPESLGKSGGA
jgi:hypothetical protein